MNALAFPPNPAFGQFYQNWVWNGSRWVCTSTPGTRIITTLFTTSAPYMPSPGLISVQVECLGGGGAGGWASVAGVYVMGGGGGGSGGYSRMTLAAALVLGGVNVTVGIGGLGPSPYTEATATSFGALCVANPGQSGAPMNGQPDELALGENGAGGPGGSPGVGDLALAGSAGGQGDFIVFDAADYVQINSARGGEIFGGASVIAVAPGFGARGPNAAVGSGAGGGGGVVNQATGSGNNMAGGNGGGGWCLVTEYCWADAIDSGCGCGPTSGQARVQAPGWQGGYGYDND